LAGLGLLFLGGWCAWGMWHPGAGAGPARPPLAVRVAAVLVGLMLGWLLDTVVLPAGPGQVALGLPLPFATLGLDGGPGQGLGGPGALACALLNLAVGVGLGHLLGQVLWRRLGHRARRRADARIGRQAFRPGRELREDLPERAEEG
jgi:hypothetical protein